MYGLILGVLIFGFSFGGPRPIPSLEWWQSLLAPLGIGALVAAAEAIIGWVKTKPGFKGER